LISIKDMMQAFILEIDVSQCLPVVVAHDNNQSSIGTQNFVDVSERSYVHLITKT